MEAVRIVWNVSPPDLWIERGMSANDWAEYLEWVQESLDRERVPIIARDSDGSSDGFYSEASGRPIAALVPFGAALDAAWREAADRLYKAKAWPERP